VLRLVQPNAEQSLKWDPERAAQFFDVLLASTAAPDIGARPALVIWPETAMPYLLNGAERLLEHVDIASGGTPVALGAVRREDGLYYNSLVVTGPGGTIETTYDKFHLVPGGEYIPFGAVLGRIGIRGMAERDGGGFASGAGPATLDLGGLGRVLPLICYEAIFPQHLHRSERADWILQITNDAWFGDLTGPYQHLAQARMRAVEQGLPLVRAANTGVSAVIDATGQVTEQLPLNQRGFLDAVLPGSLPPTPYARTGDWPVLALMLFLALILCLPRSRELD
jgi:apolipoprotein N-acyltransferase